MSWYLPWRLELWPWQPAGPTRQTLRRLCLPQPQPFPRRQLQANHCANGDCRSAHYNACASNGSGHECTRPNGSANGGTHSNSGAGHRLLGVRIYSQPRLGSRRVASRVLRVCTQRNSSTGRFRLQRGYRWSRLESVQFQGSAGICCCFV